MGRSAFAILLAGLASSGAIAAAQQSPKPETPPVFVDPNFRIEKLFRVEQGTLPPEHGYLFWSEPVRDRVADRVRPNPLPAEDTLSGLLVFLQGSPMRPDGVAAIEVKRKFDCATRTVTWDSHSTYSEAGDVLKQEAAPPREIALRVKPSEDRIEAWARLCNPPPLYGIAMPPPPPSADGKNWPSYFMLGPARVKTASEAISQARALEADLTAARKQLPAGEYVALPAGSSVLMMDYKNRVKSGGFTRMTWLDASTQQTGYRRHVYNVDCASKTASMQLTASYSEDGTLKNVTGRYPVTTFNRTSNEKQLAAACKWPGRGLGERFYKTEADALVEARKIVAEAKAKAGPERTLADFAKEIGAVEVRPGEYVSQELLKLREEAKPAAVAPAAPPIVRLDLPQ